MLPSTSFVLLLTIWVSGIHLSILLLVLAVHGTLQPTCIFEGITLWVSRKENCVAVGGRQIPAKRNTTYRVHQNVSYFVVQLDLLLGVYVGQMRLLLLANTDVNENKPKTKLRAHHVLTSSVGVIH